jgi:hypothetical protein
MEGDMSNKSKLDQAVKKVTKALEKADILDEGVRIIPPDEYLSEKVPFRAFKDNDKYKDDIVVIINGKSWVIQRGIQVMIPRFVLHAIENSERQKAQSANYSQSLTDMFMQREKQLT